MAANVLYLHVPFCRRRCRYCDFPTQAYDRALAEAYLVALAEEVEARVRRLAPRTLYIGGGTPTALRADQLTDLLNLLGTLDLSRLEEYTVEANPGTFDVETLLRLREAGVNRLSLGVQTFHAEGLKRLGRIHDARRARAAVSMAREAGFENLSLDLIYGWPGQRPADWREDLETVAGLAPEHLSCYGLTYEEGTPLWRDRRAGRLMPLTEEEERLLFDEMASRLADRGYDRYEISSFARPGGQCRHNRAYWEGEEYVGLGAGAHSLVAGTRFCNSRSPAEYIRLMTRHGRARVWEESLPPERAARERVVIGLRLREGLAPETFAAATGFELEELLGRELPPLLEGGWLEWTEGRLRLSDRALPVADSILAELVV